ncbi:MAG: sulfatase-like hydrolase/transferase [Anaerolineae bacterium]
MPALIDDLLNILLGGILLAYRTILLILALLVNSARPALTVSPAHMRADSPTATAQPLGLPNIVFILADDLDLDLDTVTTMPHLQALLAGQGITFTHFFVNASICCPSRASLLRGQYVHNHGVYTNGPPPTGGFETFRDLGLENDTIATRLQDVGYRTALFGKYLNRYPYGSPSNYIPPGWGEWYSPSPTAPGYNQFNYTLNENGTLVAYGSDPADYLQDVLTTQALSFITRTVTSGEPFFAYFSSFSPHTPSTPAPRHTTLFTDTLAPRPPSFNELDVSDKPQWIQNLPLLTPEEVQQIDDQYRLWLQSMQAVDETIAALVETLEATGQLNNTYIFFTSDNGYHMGQHRLLPGKYLGYEEDIHVPLFVRGPQAPISQTVPYLASIVDLAPTLADIAGIEIPAYTDGRSLLPLLGGSPPAAWRQALLFEQYVGDHHGLRDPLGEPPDPFDSPRFQSAPLFYSGLRTADLKYIEYDTGERELYNLANDPFELENLAASADPTTLAQLAAWLSLLKGCAADTCRSLEMRPPPPPPICAELDFDHSGSVTVIDVAQVAAHWGETPQTPAWDPRYDLDDNLVIDAADMAVIAARWGEICP